MSVSSDNTISPIKVTIAALGGQGGGVLADWLIEIALEEAYLAQSTSVPGVAQRTGATIYYLEFLPGRVVDTHGREPVLALTPAQGDVDCVIASELAEVGRVIQRGLVTPQRTTLIASSHREYSIAEKMAMGTGTADSVELARLARAQSKRLILFDMNALAQRHQSVISSVLLGALGGSGVLPFRKTAYESAIRKSGIAVATNLAAFDEAFERAARGEVTGPAAARSAHFQAVPAQSRSRPLQPILNRIHKLPSALQPLVLEGTRRMIDYQDATYAGLYLQRVERIAQIDARRVPGTLTEVTARGLALWMSFEDPMRVADLKTRSARFARVHNEVHAATDQIVGITDFMKPRVEEVAATMPPVLGRLILSSPVLRRWIGRWTGGRKVRTGTLGGFLMLHMLGGMKRWRRVTLRFQEENARIEDWLDRIERLAATDYLQAVELARAQRLIKGYGETHERGWRNFSRILERLDTLAARADGAALLARLQEAALADEDGVAMKAQLEALDRQRAS